MGTMLDNIATYFHGKLMQINELNDDLPEDT
jgi:hypothetical protein